MPELELLPPPRIASPYQAAMHLMEVWDRINREWDNKLFREGKLSAEDYYTTWSEYPPNVFPDAFGRPQYYPPIPSPEELANPFGPNPDISPAIPNAMGRFFESAGKFFDSVLETEALIRNPPRQYPGLPFRPEIAQSSPWTVGDRQSPLIQLFLMLLGLSLSRPRPTPTTVHPSLATTQPVPLIIPIIGPITNVPPTTTLTVVHPAIQYSQTLLGRIGELLRNTFRL